PYITGVQQRQALRPTGGDPRRACWPPCRPSTTGLPVLPRSRVRLRIDHQPNLPGPAPAPSPRRFRYPLRSPPRRSCGLLDIHEQHVDGELALGTGDAGVLDRVRVGANRVRVAPPAVDGVVAVGRVLVQRLGQNGGGLLAGGRRARLLLPVEARHRGEQLGAVDGWWR